MRGVGGEAALTAQGTADRVDHRVERAGQPAQLRWTGHGHGARVQPPGRDGHGGPVEVADRPQHPAGQLPPGQDGEQERQHPEPGQLPPAHQHGRAEPVGRRHRHHHRDHAAVPPDRLGDHHRGLLPGPHRRDVVGPVPGKGRGQAVAHARRTGVEAGPGDQSGHRPAVRTVDRHRDAVGPVVRGDLAGQALVAVAAQRVVGERGEPVRVGEPVEVHRLGLALGDVGGQRYRQRREQRHQQRYQDQQETAQHAGILARHRRVGGGIRVRDAAARKPFSRWSSPRWRQWRCRPWRRSPRCTQAAGSLCPRRW